GVPKLADIGLVAATGQRSFVGTEGYVPPEGPGTPQADIFSLGKLLYEISSGKDRLRFPEIDSGLSTRPDKEALLRLNDVLVKACANDPRKRYASAAQMRDDLAALEQGKRRPVEKSRVKFAVAAFTILLIAGLVFSTWWRSRVPARSDVSLQTTIRTEPPGALVLLDDHAKKSPATFNELEPRKYKLRVMSPGYDPIETIFDLGNRKSFEPPLCRPARNKGPLNVESNPPGAQFTLRSEDGQISRTGVAPQKIVDLPTGKYTLIAKRGDWEMRDGVEIHRGDTTRKSFAFVNGTVSITSEPPGAKILVDGIPHGRTPLRIELPALPHELVAQLDDWPAEQQSLAVQGQQENSAHFVFANGSVKITSAPSGATVLANGRALGQTPLVIEEVRPGDVTYELQLAGYKPGSVSGKVKPQQQKFLAARLEKSLGPAPRQPFTNSLGMKLVPLGDIQISVWETRVHEYQGFCRRTGRHYEPADFHQTATDPAVKVSWFDAMAFCKWLTEKEHDENLIEDRQAYRLPTDLELSMAAGLVNESGATPEIRDGKIKNEFPWGKQ